MDDFKVIDLTGEGGDLSADNIIARVIENFPAKEEMIKSKKEMIEFLIDDGAEAIDFQFVSGLNLPIAVQFKNSNPIMGRYIDLSKRKEFCLKFSSVSEQVYEQLELIEEAYLNLIGVCDYVSASASKIVDNYKDKSFVNSRIFDPYELASIGNEYFLIGENVIEEIDTLWFIFLGQGFNLKQGLDEVFDEEVEDLSKCDFKSLLANPPFESKIRTEALEEDERTIYDPCCGSGSFLLSAKKVLA
jgi:hypothetical protein